MLYVTSYSTSILCYIPYLLFKMNTFSLFALSLYANHCINLVGLNSIHLCTLSCFTVSWWTRAVFELQRYYGNNKSHLFVASVFSNFPVLFLLDFMTWLILDLKLLADCRLLLVGGNS